MDAPTLAVPTFVSHRKAWGVQLAESDGSADITPSHPRPLLFGFAVSSRSEPMLFSGAPTHAELRSSAGPGSG